MEARELPGGTVTLLFTDIEGSTRMVQEVGREAYVRALSEHRRLLREVFTAHGGVEVEMQGDSFHFAFPFARDAAAAAVAGQLALQEHEWETQPIKVRIGLHTGEPMQADGLYAGIDVHHAARVMSAGHGGQTLISQRTVELVTGELPGGITLLDLGEHRLKDLTAPQRLYQLGAGDFPPLKTLSARTNLPIAASPLIGREAELDELLALLRDGSRLITVTGSGGSGKTRLALQAAADLVEDFRDGVFWIPLAGLRDPDLVLASVAQALGGHEELASYLAEREALLVLDNFEHVIAASAPLAELLAVAPGAKALVTSRAPLHVDGEHEFPLDALAEDEAMTLFVERARAAGRQLDMDEHVAEICRRLDNLPLALELAAARTKLLAPGALLGRLEQRLPLLTGGRRDAPDRQRTLRATIEWSYELLDLRAKQLFARVSVFAGSFSFDAAEQICDADLDALAALVDLSLLKPIGDDRFLMLETIREYALGRLDDSGEREATEAANAEHFLALAEELEPHLSAGPSRVPTVDRLAMELDNLHAALTQFDQSGRGEELLRLATAMWRFWMARGYVGIGRHWLEKSFIGSSGVPSDLHAHALEALGVVCAFCGDSERSVSLTTEAVELFRTLGDSRGVAETINNLGVFATMAGKPQEAAPLLEKAISVAGSAGNTYLIALATTNLASVKIELGDTGQAATLLGRATELYEQLGDAGRAAGAGVGLGPLLIDEGRYEAAAQVFARCLAAVDALPQREYVALALVGVAAILAHLGDYERVPRLFGAADAMVDAIGETWDWVATPHEQSTRDRALAMTRNHLAPAVFDQAYDAGHRLTSEEAVSEASDIASEIQDSPLARKEGTVQVP